MSFLLPMLVLIGLVLALPIFLVLVGAALLMMAIQKRRQPAAITEITMRHANTLRVKRLQLRRTDEYGVLIVDKWHKHLKYYAVAVLSPELELQRHGPLHLCGRELYDLIDSVLDRKEDGSSAYPDVMAIPPLAFEGLCAEMLTRAGWQAAQTKASGDQGVDVVASRGAIRAVFQCKKWAGPIGNKAVQEAIAGREFYAADLAFVVSTTDFTRSARELAARCNVFLIHYSELADLTRYLRGRSKKPRSRE